MTTDDCVGKEKVSTALADLKKVEEFTAKTLEEYSNRLIKELCCVSYPVTTKYFSWKKFKFLKKITQEKLGVFYRKNNHSIFTLIVTSEIPKPYDAPETKKYELIVSTEWQSGNLVAVFEKWGYPKYIKQSYDEFVHEITNDVALHTFTEESR